MELKTTVLAGATLLAIMISGCAGTPQLDENWGRSYEEAKTTQILNPDGSDNLQPVEGIQGPFVEKILNNRLHGNTNNKEK